VPGSADDINLDAPADFEQLDRYIQAEPCLRGRRGRILERNSCREPWVHITNARLAKVLALGAGHSLHVGVDVFNLLNLFNHRWGLVRGTTAFDQFGNVPLLGLVGYDVARQRGIYRVLTPQRNRVFPDLSRWRLRLNTRYVF
jgi:hypothetical protein